MSYNRDLKILEAIISKLRSREKISIEDLSIDNQLLDKIPLGRLGNPVDIANAVAFLASDKASYITGETIHINGGMLMI